MRLDEGALTFALAPRWFSRIDKIAADGRIDLADVASIDSAGVALLLGAARRARRRGTRLELVNAPKQLRALLVFFGVDELFVTAAT